jgi:hypothetical protein
MGRISASGAQDLYNAYASVYKTTEEDFSEIESLCEEWLQERIEEEFDFSQNTIEELAEALKGSLMDKAKQDGATRAAAQGAAFKSFADRGGILGFLKRRLQGARDRVQQSGGSRGQGNRPIAGNPNRQGGSPLAADIAASRRQAARLGDAPARETGVPRGQVPPGATVTAKPVAPKPVAPKPAAAAPTKPATPPASTATPAKPVRSISQDLADLRAMRTASQMRQQGKKINGKIATGAGVQAASKSVSDLNKGASQYMKQDADLFDIVKGHLMSEGYADTEEAALAIMANMSEEWKQTILEADSVDKMRERAEKRRQQRYGKQGGGGRDDYRPYTEDDYKNPKPGYGSSQVKPA